MIRLSKNKGYLLAVLMMFVSILMTAVLGIHAYVRHFAREVWVQDVEHAKGYYAALAGLRYAAILLKDPSSIPFDANHSYTVTGTELGGNLSADVIGSDPANLNITITEITSGADQGKYTVTASYIR